jgi:hypothetical protein
MNKEGQPNQRAALPVSEKSRSLERTQLAEKLIGSSKKCQGMTSFVPRMLKKSTWAFSSAKLPVAST